MALPTTINNFSSADIAVVGPFKVSSSPIQSYTPQNSGTEVGNITAQTKVASEWVPDFTGPVSGLGVVQLKKTGTPTDNFTIELRSGSPTGTLLATTVAVGMGSLSTGYLPFTLTFAAPADVVSGNSYYLVAQRSGANNASNYPSIGIKNPNVGLDIQAFDGSNWSILLSDISFTFKALGEAYYIIGRDQSSSDTIHVQKAVDPSSSFSTANSIATTSNKLVQALSGYQVGNVIHLAAIADTSGTAADLRYYTFDTVTDTFSLSNDAVQTAFDTRDNTLGQQYFVSIVVRGDGVPLILYNGARVASMGSSYSRVVYARKVSGAWTANVATDAGGQVNCLRPVAALGSSNRTHFHWADTAATGSYQRALNSANTLQSPSAKNTNIGDPYDAKPGTFSSSTCIVLQAGSQTFVYISADSPIFSGFGATVGGTDGILVPIRVVIDDDGSGDNNIYVFYHNSGDDDLHESESINSAAFTQGVNAFSTTLGTADDNLSKNGTIYQRGSNYVYPYVIDDAGTLKYNEYVVRSLVVADSPPPTHEGRLAETARIIALAQPNPWVYAFQGGRAPYAPKYAATLDVPLTLSAALYTDTDVFFTATVSPGAVDLLPSLYTDTDTFFTQTVNTISDPPFSHKGRSAQLAEIISLKQPTTWPYTFEGRRQPYEGRKLSPQDIALQTLTATLYTDTDVFFDPTVTASYDLTVSLYTDTDTFFDATVSVDQVGSPTHFARTAAAAAITATWQPVWPYTFEGRLQPYEARKIAAALVASQDLITSLYTDTDVFFDPTVTASYDLTAALYTDADTFFSATVDTTASPPVSHPGRSVQAAEVVSLKQPSAWPYTFEGRRQPYEGRKLSPQDIAAQTLNATLYTDTDVFFDPTVTASYDLSPQLYADTDTFFTQTVSTVAEPPVTHPGRTAKTAEAIALAQPNPWVYAFEGGRQPFVGRKLPPVLLSPQELTPSLYSDTDVFFTATVTATYDLTPSLYTDTDTFFTATVTTSYDLSPSLYTDTDTFFTQTVSASYDLSPSLYTDTDTFFTQVVSTVANPPFTQFGRTAQLAELLALTQPKPWTYAFQGRRQPFEGRKLPPSDLGRQDLLPTLYTDTDVFFSPTVTATYDLIPSLYDDTDEFFTASISVLGEIPFTHVGRTARIAELIALAQPPIWNYSFQGRRQPYEGSKLPPSVVAVPEDNPPFGYPRRQINIRAATEAAQPSRWPYVFQGRRQPYESRKLPPAITSVTVNNPPFSQFGRGALTAEILSLIQPKPWAYTFTGGYQPYTKRRLAPSALATSQDLNVSLYTDTDTFFTATVSAGAVTLAAGLYTDADTFFTQTVASTYTLTPSLYTDADTFFTATVTNINTLSPSLYTDTDTFFTSTIGAALQPSLYTDADVFFSATVATTVDLVPSLYADADVFFTAAVIGTGADQTLVPALFIDNDVFYTHTLTARAPGAASSLRAARVPDENRLATPAADDRSASVTSDRRGIVVPHEGRSASVPDDDA